jgi:glycosyltransferase involved in cell wall biosynthesis
MITSVLPELKPLMPLKTLPQKEGDIDVSLIIPARNAASTLKQTVQEAHSYLSRCFPGSFEIILVPNPAPNDQKDQTLMVAKSLANQFNSIRICPHDLPPGKGAALRTGFQGSRGRFILFTDSDLPYELDFFEKAVAHLKSGYDLVTGNRRLPSSTFNIPVHLLPLAYGRHRLGLWYNRLVRTLLPIRTTDTQAGIKAFSRRLAFEAFQRQTCPGFLFDLEIFLTSLGQGYSWIEFPITLHLNSEKSTVRILRECILVGYWLSRITLQNKKGHYGKKGKSKYQILPRYQSAPLSTRFFLTARWKLTPYSRMAAHLPQEGRVLDLGCGHGLFALAAAMQSPSREVLGIDHDQARVRLGTLATQDLPNIRFEAGNMTHPPHPEIPYSAISIIDAMHYFDPITQETILKNAFQLLEAGGTLLIREVDPEGGAASVWNRYYEKIATGIGFTQAEKKGLHFRTRPGWENVMKSAGFKVSSEKCSHFLFADILYVCERPS